MERTGLVGQLNPPHFVSCFRDLSASGRLCDPDPQQPGIRGHRPCPHLAEQENIRLPLLVHWNRQW
ncbi:unnamed protein product [Sphenostylis stenocarpa]|uniref:Uncharacterized protein n=1 Tax=Sphenostylis stenocarpa TaxID=92480 RepID=A0AA86T022_9FABA|nr:unnamed protein product [Sphenostylis stenocarpa]